MKKYIVLLAMALIGASYSYAQQAESPAAPIVDPDYIIELWPDGAPTDNGATGPERDMRRFASNISKPTLSFFIPKNPNGMAVIVCAGGGYSSVWYGTEGYANSVFYTDRGITCIVLKYRLPNGHPEVPLDDVQEAFRVVRSRAAELGIKKVGVAGHSAGGHLPPWPPPSTRTRSSVLTSRYCITR